MYPGSASIKKRLHRAAHAMRTVELLVRQDVAATASGRQRILDVIRGALLDVNIAVESIRDDNKTVRVHLEPVGVEAPDPDPGDF